MKVPVLTIQGAEDEYGTLEHATRIEAKAGAGARTLVLPNCGHSPHKDRSEASLRAMLNFVSKALKGSGLHRVTENSIFRQFQLAKYLILLTSLP